MRHYAQHESGRRLHHDDPLTRHHHHLHAADIFVFKPPLSQKGKRLALAATVCHTLTSAAGSPAPRSDSTEIYAEGRASRR